MTAPDCLRHTVTPSILPDPACSWITDWARHPISPPETMAPSPISFRALLRFTFPWGSPNSTLFKTTNTSLLKHCSQFIKVKCVGVKLVQSQYIWRTRFWKFLVSSKIIVLLQLLLWAIHIFLLPIFISQTSTVQGINTTATTMHKMFTIMLWTGVCYKQYIIYKNIEKLLMWHR